MQDVSKLIIVNETDENVKVGENTRIHSKIKRNVDLLAAPRLPICSVPPRGILINLVEKEKRRSDIRGELQINSSKATGSLTFNL